jgi:hypothetical protein
MALSPMRVDYREKSVDLTLKQLNDRITKLIRKSTIQSILAKIQLDKLNGIT